MTLYKDGRIEIKDAEAPDTSVTCLECGETLSQLDVVWVPPDGTSWAYCPHCGGSTGLHRDCFPPPHSEDEDSEFKLKGEESG